MDAKCSVDDDGCYFIFSYNGDPRVSRKDAKTRKDAKNPQVALALTAAALTAAALTAAGHHQAYLFLADRFWIDLTDDSTFVDDNQPVAQTQDLVQFSRYQ